MLGASVCLASLVDFRRFFLLSMSIGRSGWVVHRFSNFFVVLFVDRCRTGAEGIEGVCVGSISS